MKNTLTETTFAFIGLGVMGSPIAQNLLSAGYPLRLFSRSGVPKGIDHPDAQGCESASEAVIGSSLIFLMLPDGSHVDDVLFGDGAVANALTPGQIIVDLSSISPEIAKRAAEKIAALGCHLLDAPVSGGEVGAIEATLSIMVGGDASVFESVLPVLSKIGRNISHIGPSGTGQITKLANQIIVALNIEAVAEALVFAQKAGADAASVRRALMGGFAASRALELHGERMIARDFNPGFRISLHRKDLASALDTAQRLGISLPNTTATQQIMKDTAAQTKTDLDHSALVQAIEKTAGIQLGETRTR